MGENTGGEGDLVHRTQLRHQRGLGVGAWVVVEVVAVAAVALAHESDAGAAHVAPDVGPDLQELARCRHRDVTLVGGADGDLQAASGHDVDLEVGVDGVDGTWGKEYALVVYVVYY